MMTLEKWIDSSFLSLRKAVNVLPDSAEREEVRAILDEAEEKLRDLVQTEEAE